MYKINIIANYIGQGLSAAIGFLLIPVYIKYLGIEAYGIIGFFAAIQVWMSFWENGFTTVLNKEFARYKVATNAIDSLHSLLRTIEITSITIGGVLIIIFWTGADWLAEMWLSNGKQSVEMLGKIIRLMGFIFALKLLEGIYKSVIIGMQKQVLLNGLILILNIARGVGAVIILTCVSNDLLSFFIWQLVFGLFGLIVTGAIVKKIIPNASKEVTVSFKNLSSLRSFGGGVALITLLSLLSAQSDKIILSKLLSLSEYGYYSLALTSASVVTVLLGPVVQAFFPKICESISVGDSEQTYRIYHLSSQVVSIIFGSVSILLIFNTDLFLNLWIKDGIIVDKIVLLVRLLLVANLINGLIWIPFQVQIAHGWTSLIIKSNAIALFVVIPAVIYMTPLFGANASAIISIAMNIFYLIVNINLMHKKILTSGRREWYVNDIGIPIISSIIIIYFFGIFKANFLSIHFGGYLYLIAGLLLSLCVSICSSKKIRLEIIKIYIEKLKNQKI